MEMSIAALSMAMATQSVQNNVSIGMMKKTMEQTEQTAQFMTEMLSNMPSPDGRGNLLNIKV